MAAPDAPQPVKVGVLLGREPGDLGEWIAAAAAFDAAGADALWIDVVPEPQLDPLSLVSALATVTARSLLVMAVPPADAGIPARARTLATIRRLSGGRLRILGDAVLGDPHPGGVRQMPGDPDVFEFGSDPDRAERWVSTPVPQSRVAWRAAIREAAVRGMRGVVVPADPRLLDLLRNPDDPGDRHDLQLAVG